jgi:hypothetical protein
MVETLILNYLSLSYENQCKYIRKITTDKFAGLSLRIEFKWAKDYGNIPLWETATISSGGEFYIHRGNRSIDHKNDGIRNAIIWLDDIEKNINKAFALICRYQLNHIRIMITKAVVDAWHSGSATSSVLNNVTKKLECEIVLPFYSLYDIDDLPMPEVIMNGIQILYRDIQLLKSHEQKYVVLSALLRAIWRTICQIR